MTRLDAIRARLEATAIVIDRSHYDLVLLVKAVELAGEMLKAIESAGEDADFDMWVVGRCIESAGLYRAALAPLLEEDKS